MDGDEPMQSAGLPLRGVWHPVNVFQGGHGATTCRRLLQVDEQVPVASEEVGQGVLESVLASQGLCAVDDGDPVNARKYKLHN
eukprot:6214027-Pleurochrysis_carterae.AAC.4